MKRLIGKTLVLAGLASGLTGCYTYNDIVDPCYPERYEFHARNMVCAAVTPQVANGHMLDQTVFNWYFEKNTAKLNPAGLDRLRYMIRRRPVPDTCIYIATAELHELGADIPYGGDPKKFAEAREKLDKERATAVEDFLTAETYGMGLLFDIKVGNFINPAEPYMMANPMYLSVVRNQASYQGTLFGGAGATPPSGSTPGGMAGGR